MNEWNEVFLSQLKGSLHVRHHVRSRVMSRKLIINLVPIIQQYWSTRFRTTKTLRPD